MNAQNSFPQRKRMRLENFDYSTPGNYFITVIVQGRLNLFGDVIDGKLLLNQAGKTIENALLQITKWYQGVILTHYVVMPNHIHAILTITNEEKIFLAEIMRKFKSYSTHQYIEGIRKEGWMNFNKRLWQHNYYEHIIRNQRAYDFIACYIENNPMKWNKDAINPLHDEDKEEIMKQILQLT
ncbi:MAG: transposase [Prevotella sp.]|nr:transposase [Prevotella sp.]